MSQETVKAFYEAVTKDQDLQAIRKISSKDEAVKELIAFAGRKGYQFTAADLEAFEEKHAQKLSADDLEKVNAAGSGRYGPPGCTPIRVRYTMLEPWLEQPNGK